MPFTDRPPTVVFPDTRGGKAAWADWQKSERTVPYFCDLYEPDQFAAWKNGCSRRDPSGVRKHSLCFRCIGGFLYDFDRSVRQESDEVRLST